MSWTLTEEQELIRDSIRTWVEQEVMPVAPEFDAKNEFPMELFKRAGELGFVGMCYPVEYGGGGQSYLMELVLAEEVGKASPVLAMAIGCHCAVSRAVWYWGNEEQRQKYLTKAASGELIFATTGVPPTGATNTEPFAMGRKDGDDVIIDCEMPYCTAATVVDVFNMPGMLEDGTMANVLIPVDKHSDKINIAPYELSGMHGLGLSSVSYKEVRVPAEDILTWAPIPSDQAAAWLYYTANLLGACETIFEKTKEFTLQRSRMGKPLASFQAVSHTLVKAYSQMELIRALIEAGIKTFDNRPACVPLCFVAKSYASETIYKVAKSLIDLWGGMGVAVESGVMRYFNDIVTMTPGELTTFALYDAIAYSLGLPVDTQPDMYNWPEMEF